MNIRRSTRRITAFLALLGLVFALGGRFVLDMGSDLASSHTIEKEHGQECPPFHDHLLCIQLLRSPWSAQPASSALLDRSAILAADLPDLEVVHPGDTAPSTVARSPPSHL